ncbi:abortive infection bacteriophage resistance protein [Clostridium sp. CAG:1000]|jgi:abortive infection bacteriophage resistance protein|nr:abortive infection bacteriophage resistance protein [Clostridium sp. CAG:1000]
MAAKIFKTIDEQIEILRSKGMVFEDYDKAREILLRENYFFLNGYRSPFLMNGTKRFIEGTTFEELYSLFTFDRFFRNIIFKNVLIVENNYKSIYSYVLSKKYGYKEKDYLNINNFDRSKEKNSQINDLLRKLKRQIRINGYQHQATSHYINNYGYIPMWVGVKVLSFGLMSELFTILKSEDRKEIADYYNLSPDKIENYMSILANYRNLCAHEDILFNHETQKTIADTTFHLQLGIPKVDDEYIYGKHDIFALLIILKELLTTDDFKMMMNEICYEIDKLSSKLKVIDVSKVLYRMGFPENYKQLSYLE